MRWRAASVSVMAWSLPFRGFVRRSGLLVVRTELEMAPIQRWEGMRRGCVTMDGTGRKILNAGYIHRAHLFISANKGSHDM